MNDPTFTLIYEVL